MIISVLLILNTAVVFGTQGADPSYSGSYSELETDEIQQFMDKIHEFFKLILSIAGPVCTVCIAAGAFRMFFGDQQSIAKAKTQIVHALIALVILVILPLSINAFISTDNIEKWWYPPAPQTQANEDSNSSGNSNNANVSNNSNNSNDSKDKKDSKSNTNLSDETLNMIRNQHMHH